MRPQSLLLAAENIPHYINKTTRKRVLRSYQELQRNIGKLADPFARDQLRLLAQHSFAGYKFVSDTNRINALLDYAETHEFKWADLASQRKIKEVHKVLEIAFTTFGVKETPLKRLMAHPPQLCDHKSLCYRLNNISKPHIADFEGHAKKMNSISGQPVGNIEEPYWKLVRLMQTSAIKFGRHRRRLHFWPEDIVKSTLDVFGKPIMPSRQKNTLSKLYDKFLRDALPPVHPKSLEYVAKQIQSPTLPRIYRRRFRELGNHIYTLDEDGKIRLLEVI